MEMAGLRDTTLHVVRDIYTDSVTHIKTKSETFPPIPCQRGIKQGCPLSPILFNLVTEVVIRALEQVPGSGWMKRNLIARLLCSTRHSHYVDLWKLARDQGRTAACTTAHPASNHWVNTGKYTSFGEYRFTLKARLNVCIAMCDVYIAVCAT